MNSFGEIMKYILISLLIIFSLTGCKRTVSEQVAFEKTRAENIIRVNDLNQKSFDAPVTIAKNKNGQVVTMATTLYICETCDGRYPDTHYVYMVDGTVSENYTYRSGKTSHNRTEVFLKPEQSTGKEKTKTVSEQVGSKSILETDITDDVPVKAEEEVFDGSIVVNGITYQLLEVVSRMSLENFKKYDLSAPIDINGVKYIKLK